MMTKYTTEKRKANVGERILITAAGTTRGAYKNGDVLTVESLYHGYHYEGIFAKELTATHVQIHDYEYEVVVEASTPPKPTKSARITALESQVAALTARVTAMEVAQLVKPKPTLTDLLATYPTPNEQRKAVIERAKAFVAETLAKKASQSYDGAIVVGAFYAMPKFFVNAEKRIVTFVAESPKYKHIRATIFAKCDPSDVFNADIGKAIALGRALGLDVTEFTKAVQPTEVVVGHVVYDNDATNGSDGNVRVKEVMPPGYVASDKGYTFEDGWAFLKYAVIVNDTDAKY